MTSQSVMIWISLSNHMYFVNVCWTSMVIQVTLTKPWLDYGMVTQAHFNAYSMMRVTP